MNTDIEVFADLGTQTIPVGIAHITRSPKGISTTFEYADTYLTAGHTQVVDPALELVTGNQHMRRLPGAFGDSAPDRWGRRILTRREREVARAEGRTARTLDDLDLLLAVNDLTRQGNLRYRHRGANGAFLSSDTDIPTQLDLPVLLNAADAVDADSDEEEVSKALKMLLRAGTGTLGGARPKASISLNGRLSIAKFPSVKDPHDVIGWEAVALDIAEAAGIQTPARKLVSIGDRHVLILDRFDRDARGGRLGYMSAMTMMEAVDGDNGDYSEIAERLGDHSGDLSADRAALFDRAALNVILHNTDDHMRNHGLILGKSGWHLSPVFDVNPNPDQAQPRSTSIAGADTIADEWDGLMVFASECGLLGTDAAVRAERVADAAAGWGKHAGARGVSGVEIGVLIDARVSAVRSQASALRTTATRSDGARRGKTTSASNDGSFAPHRRDKPAKDL